LSRPAEVYIEDVWVVPVSLTRVNITAKIGGKYQGQKVEVGFNGHMANLFATAIASTVLFTNVAVQAKGEESVVPAPWTPDSPALHTATVVIPSSGDAATARFGLRILGVQKGRFTINGEV